MHKMFFLLISLYHLFTIVAGNSDNVWESIIDDHLIPWTKLKISKQLIDDTYHYTGSNIIYQHINGELFIIDKNNYCYCNISVFAHDTTTFQRHLILCRAVESILDKLVKSGNLPNFELVISLDDIPMWYSRSNISGIFDIETRQNSIFYPGFGAIRCWSKGGLSFPIYGYIYGWDIHTSENYLNFSKNVKFDDKASKVTFRGSMNRGCSFEKNALIDFTYKSLEFNWTKTNCGRRLFQSKFGSKYPKYIDFGYDYLSLHKQNDMFKYILSIEGYGGWSDRLSSLYFTNMLVFDQEHPCEQWFEPLVIPYKHYIPVHHDFRNLPNLVIWAESHPNLVKQILKNGNDFAQQYLRQQGILLYAHTLLKKYSKLLNYKITRRSGSHPSKVIYNKTFLDDRCRQYR